ncbi:hypothetical protein IE81DRAFT_37053 [Ceraceosorus guamensis]|uniref:Uncharacterized protein n=1 Tax=Ceraceosorus guamensis TaxID=1522189 RepID=A0A316W2T2_9BASI|nr:hypothetical protein IE81DRAFT_37053 [Ceraceosorus guamensis]PWN44176.1 hypothetical protein IE81DRAFT_37053 [Ceraceosorus guamensis]
MAPKRRSPSPTPSSATSSPKKGKAAPASWTEQDDQHLLLALLVSDGNMPVLNEEKRAAMTLVSKRSEEAVKVSRCASEAVAAVSGALLTKACACSGITSTVGRKCLDLLCRRSSMRSGMPARVKSKNNDAV